MLLFFLINIISYLIILKLSYMYFKQKMYYPFRIAEIYAFLLHSVLVTIVMNIYFEIHVILTISFINILMLHAIYHIGFMIQSSPRTKILLDLSHYKKIDKNEYLNIYTTEVILENRLKRFISSKQIHVENTTVKIINKKYKLLNLVTSVSKIIKYFL